MNTVVLNARVSSIKSISVALGRVQVEIAAEYHYGVVVGEVKFSVSMEESKNFYVGKRLQLKINAEEGSL
jgi:hypothetical protein